MIKNFLLSTCAAALLLGGTNLARAQHANMGPTQAVASIMPTGSNTARGVVVLTQYEGYVQVTGEVTGLKPGAHGFHIHMFGDLRSTDGMSAGGHYNPAGHKHGGPQTAEHHAGDLGNIEADAQGMAKVNSKVEGLKLGQVIGRSIVVHADPDDLTSQPAGNAGPRIGVGVIGLAEVKPAATSGT